MDQFLLFSVHFAFLCFIYARQVAHCFQYVLGLREEIMVLVGVNNLLHLPVHFLGSGLSHTNKLAFVDASWAKHITLVIFVIYILRL